MNIASTPRLVFVGAENEVSKFAAPMEKFLPVEVREAAAVASTADAGAVYIFFNEFFERFRDCIRDLAARRFPTLYAIDGILEWRHSWEFPEASGAVPWTMRPVLSHKVACIGRSQARVLESWGNTGRCEVVGLPRLDGMAQKLAPPRKDGVFRLLVATAMNPAFDERQVRTTLRGLNALNEWLRAHPEVNGRPIEVTWRLTRDMEKHFAPAGSISDPSSQPLLPAMAASDAVVTTPSTLMLEGMLAGRPVALLDFHNVPHYVPAAWLMSSEEQVEQAIAELAAPPEAKLLYQDAILHDALECRTDAAPRLAGLAIRMHEIALRCRADNAPLGFPVRLLEPDPATAEERFDLARLFPGHPHFADMDRTHLQAELSEVILRLRLERERSASLERELAYLRRLRMLIAAFPNPVKLARWIRSGGNTDGST